MPSKSKGKFKETEIGAIPVDWDIGNLSDIAEIKMGQSPPGESCTSENVGLPLLNGPTEFTNIYPKPVQFTQAGMKSAAKGSILFCVRGSTTGRMNWADREYYIGRGVASINHKKGFEYNHFIKGMLDFKKEELLSIATGSTFPNVSYSQLAQLKIQLPPIPEQQAIADFLSDLDSTIEVNQQMNKTLEAIGQALFKHWFIDFEFPNEKGKPYKSSGGKMVDSKLGEIPEGWDVKKVGDVIDIFGGTTPSTKELKYWEGGSIHWATPKDLSELDSPVLIDTERKITPEGLATISSGLLPAGTVLLSSRAPIGYTAISQIPISINQGFIAMVCNRELPKYYMLCWVQYSIDIIKSVASGTTFEEVNKSNFRRLNILVPPSGLLSTFSTILELLYEGILSNSYQCRTLISLRASLLPRLMLGKIRVNSDVENRGLA